MIWTPAGYEQARRQPETGDESLKSIHDAADTTPPKAEQPDATLLASVREHAEGGYRGECRLAACGLHHAAVHNEGSRGQARRRASNSLDATYKNLESGESVTLRYGWQPDADGVPEFYWHVACVGTGTSRAKAALRTRQLAEGLELALGASGHGMVLTWSAGEAPKTNENLSWQCDISRRRLLVPTDTSLKLEGNTATPLQSELFLDLVFGQEHVAFDSVVSAGPVCQQAFEVRVRIEPFSLSDNAVDWLKQTYDSRRFGDKGQWYLDDGAARILAETNLTDAGVDMLWQWKTDPCGYRVSCSVFAERPPPPAFPRLLGRELFHTLNLAFDTEARTPGVAGIEHAGGLDLSNCFQRRVVDGLCLLPSMGALSEAGMPAVYRDAPINLPRTGCLTLGYAGQEDSQRTVRLDDGARAQHCYVLGATGTGKSTLLHNAALQDIEAGRGVCVIDPHGDLCDDVLRSVGAERAHDVVLLDFTDFNWPVGLNFLETAGDQPAETTYIVNGMISVFHRLYPGMPEAMGPMFELYMRNALIAVIDNTRQPATLLDVVRLFEDAAFRSQMLKSCRNTQTIDFWRKQAEKASGEAELRNIAPYITSKLNQFTNNEILRPVIGQATSTFDFRRAMDDGRIVLINLAKGLLGELDARLLGMLLVGKLFRAGAGRQSLAVSQRRAFHVYIDEFQNLVTLDIAHLLSESRKYGVSCVLANQHLQQANQAGARNLVDTILGNVGNLLSFRVGPADAQRLENFMQPHITAIDLQNLPNHQLACRIIGDNAPIRPFVCHTAGSPAQRDDQSAEIHKRSRARYARARRDVEAEIRNARERE